jgi:uncharacterized protein (DUF1810 family)
MNKFQKFIQMQKIYYSEALEEIKNGKKIGHWIWFIFPQIEGLGISNMCKEYELKSLEEAKDYLNDRYLLNNLKNITSQLLIHKNRKIYDIMNCDDKKLLSSMTLFDIADNHNKCNGLFKEVINTFYNGEPDQLTINILKKKNYEETNYPGNKKEVKKKYLTVDKNRQQQYISKSNCCFNNQYSNNILKNRNNESNINSFQKLELHANYNNYNHNNKHDKLEGDNYHFCNNLSNSKNNLIRNDNNNYQIQYGNNSKNNSICNSLISRRNNYKSDSWNNNSNSYYNRFSK